MSAIEEDGRITVEGEVIGRIQGLRFLAEAALAGEESKLLKAAAVQALVTEVAARATVLANSSDAELKLTRLGEIIWQGHPVGQVRTGDHRLKPRAEVIADDILSPVLREEVRLRLQKFVERSVAAVLEPLIKLDEAEGLEGAVRGLAYRLAENYAVLPREIVAEEVKALAQEDRAKLRSLGVRFGAYTLFLPALLKPAPTDIRLLLWWLETNKSQDSKPEIPAIPPNGLTSTAVDPSKPEGFYRMCGYRVCGRRAVRVDMLERLADMIRDRLFWKPRVPEEQRPQGSVEGGGFTIVPDMMSIVGCSGEDFQEILTSLGYRSQMRVISKPAGVPDAEQEAAQATVEVPDESGGSEVPETPAPPSDEPKAEETVTAAPSPSNAAAATGEVAVWWPDGMGPFKARRPRPEKAKQPHRGDGPQNHRGGKPFAKKEGRKPDRPDAKPRRPERPADPNSPFAVLGALKAQFAKENG